MGLVSCQIDTVDTTLAHDPVAGVTIRVFDVTGTTFVTSGVTDGSGVLLVDLIGAAAPTPVRYQLRCSKLGTTIVIPQYIDVYDPLPALAANHFRVYADIWVNPGATDALLCRASGMFTDPGGRPLSDMVLQFTTIFDPLVAGGVGILSKVEIRTDSLGRASVDLYRKGKYRTIISGLHDEAFITEVPDVSAVNLVDLLFPVIASVTYAPAPPWVVLHGTTLHVVPTITTSAFVVLDPPASSDVNYISRDSAIAGVAMGSTDIIISGVSVGTTYIDLSQIDTSLIHLPAPVIVGTGAEIDVS